MPTYRHNPTGKRFLFAHIPRTAGRFFEMNLKKNDCVLEQNNIWDSVDGIEVAHFHRELYEKHFDVKNIPHISFVRNPIDRFFSASIYLRRVYGHDICDQLEDETQFFSMIDNMPFSEAVNWYRPQVDFLSEKTKVWKYENGYGKKFENWLKEVLEIDFKMDAFISYTTGVDEGVNKVERRDKIIDNVRTFYRRDIEQLYPELATSLQKGEKKKTKTTSTQGAERSTAPI